MAVGCAQVGPPLPPSANLPAAALHFQARREGPWLDLAWQSGLKTSDGLAQRGSITPWLCIWPGGQAPPPAPTPCPRRLQAGAAEVPGTRGGARLGIKRLFVALPGVPPLPATAPGNLHVALVFANTAGQWGVRSAFHLVPTTPVTSPPAWGPAQVLRIGIELNWRSMTPSRVRIERRRLLIQGRASLPAPGPAARAVAAGWRAVADMAAGTTHFLDRQITWGQTYAYRLQSLAGSGREEVASTPSADLIVAARNDFPPASPAGLEIVATPPAAAGGAYTVALSWLPPPPAPPATVAGYNVYRRRGAGFWLRRNSQLLLTPVFTDSVRAIAGGGFAYAVTAVGANGVEGAKSAAVTVDLPAADKNP